MGGNFLLAAQLYDQGASLFAASMNWAAQGGVPVPPHIWYSFGASQFNAGRALAGMGDTWAAVAHFQNAASPQHRCEPGRCRIDAGAVTGRHQIEQQSSGHRQAEARHVAVGRSLRLRVDGVQPAVDRSG